MHELLARETNRYGVSKMKGNWEVKNPEEIKAFLGISVLMGCHRLPRFSSYWSSCDLVIQQRFIVVSVAISQFRSVFECP